MTGPQRRRAAGRVDDRGLALVEFALVAPLLVTLIFGIVDFGIAFRQSIAVTQGAREAARSASVGEVGADDCGSDITGSVSSSGTRALICRAKERTGLDPADTRVRVVIGDADGDGNEDYEPSSTMVVCVMYPLGSASGLFEPVLDGRTHRGRVQMRIDDDDAPGGLATGGETALTGGDWSFCTVD